MEEHVAELEKAAENVARTMDRAATLAKEQNLPTITAFIMASDQASGEYALELMKEEGKTPEQAYVYVGSYARFEWCLEHCKTEWVLENIADLWRSADPDDTNPEALKIWTKAAAAHMGTVTDGKRLPNRKQLTVYRGQMADQPFGIAWTLDGKIADAFARGRGIRSSSMEGSVYRAIAHRDDVLGYLTGRGESEIVIDPARLRDIMIIGEYKRVLK